LQDGFLRFCHPQFFISTNFVAERLNGALRSAASPVLQIAYGGTDVRDLVDRDRLAQRGTAGKDGHE
jgi:hypothetical protein